eukprot:Tbor_TRINITY_DN4736_c0_g1::TRINITY_DN4736_c0_g1_i1::g.16929::m.16929
MIRTTSDTSVGSAMCNVNPSSGHNQHDSIKSLPQTPQQERYYASLKNNVNPYTNSTGTTATYDVPHHFGIVIEHCIYRCAYPTSLIQVGYLRELRPKTILQLGIDMIPRNIHSALLQPCAPLNDGLDAMHLGIHAEELESVSDIRTEMGYKGNDIETEEESLRRKEDEEKLNFLTMLAQPMYPKIVNLSTLLWGSDIFSDAASSSSFSSYCSKILAPLERYEQAKEQRKSGANVSSDNGQGIKDSLNIRNTGEDKNRQKEDFQNQQVSQTSSKRSTMKTSQTKQSSSCVSSAGGPKALVLGALEYCLNAEHYPIILMCPTGEIETSMVWAALRILQNWSLGAILSECLLFSSGEYIGPTGSACGLRKGLWEFIEGELWDCLRRKSVKSTSSIKAMVSSAVPYADVSYDGYFPIPLEARRRREEYMTQQVYPLPRYCVSNSPSSSCLSSEEGNLSLSTSIRMQGEPCEEVIRCKDSADGHLKVDDKISRIKMINATTTTATEPVSFRYSSAPYWWIECAAVRKAMDKEKLVIKRKELGTGRGRCNIQIANDANDEKKHEVSARSPIELERVPSSLVKSLTVSGGLSYIESTRYGTGLVPLLGPETSMPGKGSFPEPEDV